MKLLWWSKRKLFFTEEFSLLNNKRMTKCQVILQPPKKQMLDGGNESVDAEPGRKGWQKWMVTDRCPVTPTDDLRLRGMTQVCNGGVWHHPVIHGSIAPHSGNWHTDWCLLDVRQHQVTVPLTRALHLPKVSNLDLIKPLTPTSSLLKTQMLVEQLKWLHEKAMRQTQMAGYSEGQLTCFIFFSKPQEEKERGGYFR